MNNAGDKPVVTQEEDIFAFIRECVETARSDCEGYHLSNKPGEPDLSRYDAAMTWIARFEQDTLSREGREAEPVAWLYEHPGHPKGRAPNEVVFNRHIGPLGEGWTETPLYAVAPETTDAFEQVGFYKEKLAQAEQEIEDCKAYLPKYQEALRLGRAYRDAVIGWREYDWPAGFCRRTAEMIAENAERVAGSVALPTSPEQADQADVLRERIAELEAALRFYADAEKWDDFAADQQASVFDRNFGSELGSDRGALARATISNIGSSNDG